ncbi:hypothetical protein QNH91_10860, partial [Klebsiella pneumoniae]|uniref:hypothetical protein n=1 Tax=Klebsiella pneumoniae TaxID=573 RepID=UPI0025540402
MQINDHDRVNAASSACRCFSHAQASVSVSYTHLTLPTIYPVITSDNPGSLKKNTNTQGKYIPAFHDKH